MDLDTVEVRVNRLLGSVSNEKQKDSYISSAVSSTKGLRQLPGIQMTDSSAYHNRVAVAPAFTNLPACSGDVSPHTVFTSQSKLGMRSTFISHKSQHTFNHFLPVIFWQDMYHRITRWPQLILL